MVLDEVIATARSIAGDKDAAAYRYTDNEIVLALLEARRSLAVRGVAQLTGLTVDATDGSESINPEPSDVQGMILATATALTLLRATYRQRIDAGTIGVSWMSGLEQESTITQAKAYEAMLKDVETDLQSLIIVSHVQTSATRPQ